MLQEIVDGLGNVGPILDRAKNDPRRLLSDDVSDVGLTFFGRAAD